MTTQRENKEARATRKRQREAIARARNAALEAYRLLHSSLDVRLVAPDRAIRDLLAAPLKLEEAQRELATLGLVDPATWGKL